MLQSHPAPAPDHTGVFLHRYERLLELARRVIGGASVDQAQDLVHDAFVQFVLLRPDLAAITNLDAYLPGMLLQMHLPRLRRAGRQGRLTAIKDESAGPTPPTGG